MTVDDVMGLEEDELTRLLENIQLRIERNRMNIEKRLEKHKQQ